MRRDGLLGLQTFLFVVLVANTSDASISVSIQPSASDASISVSIQQALPISVSFPISIAFLEPLAPSVSGGLRASAGPMCWGSADN